VFITASSCNAQSVEIRFTNNGPDAAFRYGNSGTADLSMLSGIRFKGMTMSPNLRVDTVQKKVYFFENPSTTGLPVDSSLSIHITMNVPGNCAVGMKATFNGFSGQVDMSALNSTDFNFVTLSMLPVRLEAFEAKSLNGSTEISWIAIEDNVDHYDVERDGGDGNGFVFLSRIMARNGTGVNRYRIMDESNNSGKIQYRLNMVDRDGSSRYSMVRIVNHAFANANGTMKIFPNPAVAGALVSLEGIGKGTVNVSLVDFSGRKVWSGGLTSTDGRGELRLTGVPGNSMYALIVRDASGITTQKKLYVR
jgi:hypothetical protein